MEDVTMSAIARAIVISVLVGAVMAPQAAAGESIQITRAADAADFRKFLPPLPDVPWLTTVDRAPSKGISMPEAGSVSALLLVPRPAEAWSPLLSQSADASSLMRM